MNILEKYIIRTMYTFFFMFAGSVQATAVTFTFTGTFFPIDTFEYRLTYDYTNHGYTKFIAAGTTINGYTIDHDWYGYSRDGISALDLGPIGLTLNDLKPKPLIGILVPTEADLWTDRPIENIPEYFSFNFFGPGSTGLGASLSMLVYDHHADNTLTLSKIVQWSQVGFIGNIEEFQFIEVHEFRYSNQYTIEAMRQSDQSVPEPTSIALLVSGLIGFGYARRKAT